MNITEILKAKGIADDVIKGILDDMKANKIYTASEENLDIRYNKLKTDHDGVNKQLTEAQALIENLQKSTKGQEEAQQQIATYKQQAEQLQAELLQTKIEAEIKVGLLAEKALDVDYLAFKLKEKGELALDDNGKIKGWEDKVAALKTQLPNQFESAGGKKVIEYQLPEGEKPGSGTITREEFNKMGYNSRVAFKQSNPEQYSQLMKG
jgi:hypothetical protein